jgi:DNA-binding transcriptional MerR regulator
MSSPTYRIGPFARLTGVSVHALRIWERRYGAFAPLRTPKGARLYSDSDVERVRLLKALTEEGHPIGSIAQLSEQELRALVEKTRLAPAEPAAKLKRNAQALAKNLISSATSFDPERAATTLGQALALLSPREVVLEVVAPALHELRQGWQEDGLCILGEHAVSALIRTELGQLVSAGSRNPGPPIVCTTPAGEPHELGVLLVSVLVAVHGLRPLYLGPNLPAPQIVEAARLSRASAVALSIVTLEPADAQREIDKVSAELPPAIELLLGGRGLRSTPNLPARAVRFDDLWAFDAWLERAGSAYAAN